MKRWTRPLAWLLFFCTLCSALPAPALAAEDTKVEPVTAVETEDEKTVPEQAEPAEEKVEETKPAEEKAAEPETAEKKSDGAEKSAAEPVKASDSQAVAAAANPAKPTGLKVSYTASGIRVSWKKVKGLKYNVYLRVSKSGARTSIASNLDASSYTWNGGGKYSGNMYFFSVEAVDGKLRSDEAVTGDSYAYLTNPTVKATVEKDTIKVSWGEVDGAEMYRVYYKTVKGSWKTLSQKVIGTSYTVKKPTAGTSYYFTVRACNNEGAISGYTSTAKTVTYLGKPTIKVAEGEGGIKITWSKVTGADSYKVYYKTSEKGSWKSCGTASACSYVWSKATKSNQTYFFTVVACDEDGSRSAIADEKSVVHFSAPSVKAEITAEGVQLSWKKIADAKSYGVYYKVQDDEGKWSGWKGIKKVTTTSYTWTKAVSGKNYQFTVKVMSPEKGCYVATPALVSLETPKVSASNVVGGIQVSWKSVPGADYYKVYYSTSGKQGSGKRFDTVYAEDTETMRCVWSGGESGKKYYFTVRAFSDSGSQSAYTFTKALLKLDAPYVIDTQNTERGIRISWEKIEGAKDYQVYYKTANQNWSRISTTSNTSYVWTGAKNRVNYYFTVRARSGSTRSDYISSNVHEYLEAPKVTATNSQDGVIISWEANDGASSYNIYYRTGTEWIPLKMNVSSTDKYTWKKAVSGLTYYFAVETNSIGSQSARSSSAALLYLAAPKVTAASDSNGVRISWTSTEGASYYNIYYKTGTGTWTAIASSTDNSYLWKGGEKGTAYTFTVQACMGDVRSAYTASKSVIYP